MRKIFLTLAILVMAICANAQTNQYFWYNGNLLMGNPIAQIDSVTFGNEETDSILIYLPHTIIKNIVVHDTTIITVHDTIRINDNPTGKQIPEGALSGEFSVSPTKKVRFSKGNILYQASTDTWRFAENQYDYVGDETYGTIYENGIKCNNNLISPTYGGWIDVFCWGTGNNPLILPNEYDNGTFVDWGINSITNGGNSANLWRTLTSEEWDYLLITRQNAENLRGKATVNNIYGYIILPDDWSMSTATNFTAVPSDWNHNTYSIDEWKCMESSGALFLPCAGRRNSYSMILVSTYGDYWSSSPCSSDGAYAMDFDMSLERSSYESGRNEGQTVRLVQDVFENNDPSSTDTPTIIHDTIYITIHDTVCPNAVSEGGALAGIFSVGDTKKVRFSKGNLQYNASTETWRFAENQWDFVGDEADGTVYKNEVKCDNALISDTYDGWIDLFGWGTGNNPTNLNGNDSFIEWGNNPIINGGNNTGLWRTMNSAEWYYLFTERENAETLYGQAIVNEVNGLIILPDDWTPISDIEFVSHYSSSGWSVNVLTKSQWIEMENKGAIFLPAGGDRLDHYVWMLGEVGSYWTSTEIGKDISFYSYHIDIDDGAAISDGQSVRLVQDVE